MIGQTLSHYRILEKLGEGGMGVLYRALDTRLDRAVAIKLLRPEAVGDADRRRRFVQEARAASALNHPNIVTIHSVEAVGGTYFLTMEMVDGRTLADVIVPGGLPLDRFLKIAVPLADAIGAAHQRGITHRDVKRGQLPVGSSEI